MLPYPQIDPTLISLGPLHIRWYGLMYLVGFFIGWKLLQSRMRRGLLATNLAGLESFLTHMIVGMLVGARVFYVFVYNLDYFSSRLWEFFFVWQGGLSFHGAASGMVVGCAIWARKNKLAFYQATDALAYCCVPGLFFGRMGNFINGELFGRPTDLPWAMIFPSDPQRIPRHPSQLYQAVTEGIVLFVALWAWQRWRLKKAQLRQGEVGALFLVGYGLLRFMTEFAREPDAQLGFVLGSLSMGQVLCFLMIGAGCAVGAHVAKTQTPYRLKA
jgi:phosphatidylglycerol:prolipoprotein diacylglycerol transferase